MTDADGFGLSAEAYKEWGERQSNMTKEQVMRWLVDFGSDWLSEETLHDTWVDHDFIWANLVRNGWLVDRGEMDIDREYKLTDKAIGKLKEVSDEV